MLGPTNDQTYDQPDVQPPLGVGWGSICTQNTGIARKGVGGLPLARIFWRICPQCTVGPPKWSFITKKWWIPPQKCALIPQNISFNHISLTFLLTKIIYALLSKNVASRIYAFYAFVGQIRQGARIRGWGGSTQVCKCQHFGCIWTPIPPLTDLKIGAYPISTTGQFCTFDLLILQLQPVLVPTCNVSPFCTFPKRL